MDYTGTGNTLNPVHPTGAAADHGLAALLRHRVPRRRLPLRPRVGARARVLRGRPPLGVLRHHPPGPDPLPGEADRRAVGRRPRRLPGRQLPDPLVGVERHLPRHDARLLARRRRRCATSRRASAARPTSTRPTAAGRSRRSTSSPRTTASRCATSSRTTRSTTRRTARATATAPTTTARGTAASKGRRTTRRSTRCARGSSGTSSTTLLALAGRADAARRRRVGADAGRQQQRLVPGQRDLVVRLGRSATRSCSRSRARLIELRRAHPVFRRTKFFEGTGEQLPDVWWMRPDGRRMTRRDWDNTESRAIGVFLNGDELRRRDAARRGGARRLVPAALQRALRGHHVPAARAPVRHALGGRAVDRAAARATGSRPGADVLVETRSIACSCRARDCSRDLPPAADARVRLRARRASSCRTCATSASRTSTSRRRCRRARARSTATTSSTRAASPTRSAARRSSASSPAPGSA